MNNAELQDAILYARGAVHTSAPNSPVFDAMVDHLKALLAEQRKRAEAPFPPTVHFGFDDPQNQVLYGQQNMAGATLARGAR